MLGNEKYYIKNNLFKIIEYRINKIKRINRKIAYLNNF